MTTQPITNQDSNNEPLYTSVAHIEALDAITVYFGNMIINAYPKPRTLSSIVQQIRTSVDLKNKVTQVRSIAIDKERQEKKKALLPYFCFQQFKNQHRVNTDFDSTNFIIQDLDHLGCRLKDVRERLVADNDVFMVFQSPSGDGLKVVFEADQPIQGDIQYRTAFGYFGTLLETNHHIVGDDDDDPARACFLSSDPEIHVNLNRKRHSIPVAPTVIATPLKRASKVAAALRGSASPGRTDAMSTLIGHLNQRGIEESVALELIKLWNKYNNTPPLDDTKVEETVRDEYERYKSQSSMRPATILIQDNCYYLVRGNGKSTTKKILSNCIIEPKELLVLEGSDCLFCHVVTNQKIPYENIMIENSDWHTKTRLLKAIGHQDCSFFGTDSDVQTLCSDVNMNMPIRKKGTKVIGLVDGLWVVEGMNISAAGRHPDISTVPYQKGADAFFHTIGYEDVDDEAYTAAMKVLYDNITLINTPETIVPILGWNFAAPVKPIIMDYKGSFPLLFVHGSQGSGKTSTAKLFMRMHGYKEAKPQMCDLKPFPMLKLMSSTNAVPVVLDEFKVCDMRQESVDNLLRFMRKSYDGEVETKGRQDQTVESYELLAPMTVMGEWSINQPAIKERIIFPRYSNIMKTSSVMQEAFECLSPLPLEAFMPRYIEFALTQDIPHYYDGANRYVKNIVEGKTVAPRIVHNLSVMILGLRLFLTYGKHIGVKTPKIKFKNVILSQLKEITGTDSGLVRSAVDQLIEELGVMVQKNEREKVYTMGGYASEIVKTSWFTTAMIANNDKKTVKCLAIRFSKVFPEFKEYAKRTGYEGDLLDKDSYMKMFDECEYVVEKSHVVDFGGTKYKSLCIDIEKAKASGIDLEGFGIE